MSNPKQDSKIKSLRLTKETVRNLVTKTAIRTGGSLVFHFPTPTVECATGPQCLVMTGYSCAGFGGPGASKGNQQ